MKFVLHRNFVLASTMGHAVRFEKGVPQEVPKNLWPEVIAIGGIAENEAAYEQEKKGPEAPNDPAERQAMIIAAFETMLSKSDREDFTAGGAPHLKTVSKLAGFSVQNKERDEAWTVFRQASEE